ncbi:MAG: sugar O-acetyltransferase [Thermoplasmata archaeon]|nr:sugar O-acetyltransferase [Thermoplasmata archaeon]
MAEKDTFERLRSGEFVGKDKAEYSKKAVEGYKLRLEYNRPDIDEDHRKEVLLKMFNADPSCKVIPPVYFDLGFNITLGPRVVINYDVVLLDSARIDIEEAALIGPGCKLVTAIHHMDPDKRFEDNLDICGKPITIGKGAWLGAGVIVLPGITIGEGAVIGAGSVVTHDVPPRTLAVGNPARVIRKLDDER